MDASAAQCPRACGRSPGRCGIERPENTASEPRFQSLLPAAARGEPGPRGEPGAKGEKGDKGDRGPAGLVAAYSKSTGETPFQPLTTGKNTLLTLSLPAGRYLLLAQATIAPDRLKNLPTVFAACRITAGAGTSSVVVAGSKTGTTLMTAATSLVHEFAAQGVAELDCNDATFGESSWSNAQIVAVQVASTRNLGPGAGSARPGGGAGTAPG